MPDGHRGETRLDAEPRRSGKDGSGGRAGAFGGLGKKLNGAGNATMFVWIGAILRRMRRSVYLGE